jgi:chemotaxis response regulator CheB
MTPRKANATRKARKPPTRTATTAVRRAEPRPAKEGAGDRPKGRHIVVGIGASAGGLEAFILLLRHLPTDTGMVFVLVQHLDPAR